MIVSPEHFRYLYVQRGEVAHAYEKGFDSWKAAYEASLDAIYDSIVPALPADASEILDVGGGLGGIGVLLCRRYPSACYRVLDGRSDDPKVLRHARTFNNAAVSADFLRANGVGDFGFYDLRDEFDRRFDLVVSFAAWCFHIPPSEYLDRVRNALAPNATVILDVRRDHTDWQEDLVAAFGQPKILDEGRKHVRYAWKT